MKKNLKHGLSKALAMMIMITLVLTSIVSMDIFYNKDVANALDSAEIGSGSYPTGAVGGATLTEGTTYTLGGHNWIAAEVGSGYAVLQSWGLTGGNWPGYAMSGTITNAAGSSINLGSANSYYNGNIDGYDISNYNSATQNLYNSIKAVEKTGMSYGKGLFLVSNAKAGQTSSGNQGSGNYWTALKSAATNHSSFGASNYAAWLGTVYGSDGAWCVDSNGSVYYDYNQNYSFVVAPAFNLDTSKVSLSGTELTPATFTHSTGINATQSISSGTEGETVNLSQMFSSVTYAGGTNNGKGASYKISVSEGTVSGTTWTLPTEIHAAKNVTVRVTETLSGKNFSKDVNFTIKPRNAGSIAVDKKSNFPESVTVGDEIDLAPYLTVIGNDEGSQSDGELSAYTLSSPNGTFSGTVFTPGKTASAKTGTITVTATGKIGDVSYAGKTTTFQLKIKPDTTGWTDRDEDVDSNGFHTYTDSETGIEWKYKCNDDGNIQYLYTESNVEKIISDGHVLLVPSAINGIQVIGIGGGTNDGGSTIVPFIPTSGKNANTTWTSIFIPSSVSIINDGAFESNNASAAIVIPGTVKKIGVDAFKSSKITSVIFNDADSLYLNTQAFAEIPSLKSVSFRGNGVTIGQRAFSNDTGLTKVDIPNGTRFVGAEQGSQDDSNAFQGTTGLTLIKIDTATVYSNIFSGNKKLAKVVFGENVTNVKYDWSGTAASNADTLAGTVARTTYSLNAETVFEMDKTSGGSPFGYANSLTVIGKNKDINGDSNAYNNTADPVKAKIAYLATYYQTNNEVKGYANGTGSSVTITAETDPSSNSGVTSTITKEQSGIEAYYKGVIFTGKKLEKDKMTVYKMFDTIKDGSYDSADFYVLRTTDADKLLAVDNTNEKNSEEKYVATYTDRITASFEEKDSITINDTDLKAGTVDVKVVVLQKDANEKIYIDHTNGHVVAHVYTVAIPVKAYTAENDFFENYGSYASVINTVNSLKESNATLSSNIENLEGQITEKNQQITDLNAKISKAEGDISTLKSQKAALEQEKNELSSQKTELEAQLKAQLNKSISDYNSLVKKFAELVGSTEIGKDDFTYTDKTTEIEYVYINGKDLPYNKSSGTEKTLSSGEKVTIFEGTGDVTGNGNASDKFYFYIKEDGVHYVTLDPADGNIVSDIVYTTTIDMMQKQAMNEIAGLKKELSDINTALGNLYASLEEALGDLGMSGFITMDGDNSQSAADKINSITSMVNTLSAAYNKTNDSMRLTIAKIDIALGYGEEVRYDGKLVKVASNTNYSSNRLPATIYYTIDGSTITYLSKEGETFSGVADQSTYATAFDSMLKANASSAVNYIKITDTVNGFKIDSADPYTDYNKAIKAFLATFDKYAENTDTLIETVNSICGTNIEIPGSGATTSEINAAVESCLQAVNTQLSNMNSQNSSYANQYAVAANALSEFLNEFDGGQNIATITISDDTATITKVSDNAAVKALGVTAQSAVTLVKDNGKVVGVTIDGRNYYLKDNGDETYTAMLISSDDADKISSAAKACVAELTVVRGKLAAVDEALAGLYNALDSAFKQMGLSGLYDDENENESAADKINSISGMITIITNSYNTLQQEYGKLSDDYQAILNAVYGDYEKTKDDVTAEDVINQIQKNQKDEIDKKVAEALKNAGAISGDSTEIQKNIAEAIEEAAAGDAYDTTGMTQDMIAALSTISEMKGQLEGLKAQVEALQNGNQAMTSMLETLSTALGFDKVQDQATIIASIQSLRDQVTSLTEANNKLTTEKADLVAANEKLTAENAALKATGSNGSDDKTYQTGYNAGYTAGFTAGTKNSGSSSNAADYQSGYNAGYNAATLALNGTNSEKVTTLTTQVNTLTNTVQTYESGIDDLYEEVLTNSDGATTKLYGAGDNASSYTTKLSKIKTYYTTLAGNYKTVNSKVTSLTASNKSLKSKNEKLEEKNNSLKESNTSLKSKVTTLQGSNSSLQSQLSSARNSSSRSSSVTASQPAPVQASQPAQVQSKPTQTESEKPSITVTADNKKESKSDKSDASEDSKSEAEPATEETTEEKDIETVDLGSNGDSLDFNATADDTADTNSNESDVIDGSADGTDAADQETSGSILPMVIFVVLFVVVIGAIVYFFMIKPRTGSKDDEEDDDDDETV